MKKLLLSLVFAVLSIGTINAQDIFDAIRFSQNFYEGTARFTSMGGAFAALGGDFTTLSINPAGVGVYRGSEVSMTPAISYSSTSSSYENISDLPDSRTKFGLSNIGYVMSMYTGSKSKGLVTMNFGIGYNKLNNFNYNASASGRSIDEKHSFVSNILEQAYTVGYHVDEFTARRPYDGNMTLIDWPVVLAWQSNLITNIGTNAYISNYSYGNHSKHATTQSKGNVGEYVFTFGGNVSHKLYFGLTFGIQDVNYESTRLYDEVMDNPTDLSYLIFDQYYRTSGIGYNLKAGLIYRPMPDLRLAFAVHTPTFFELTDEYSAYQRIDIINDGNYSASTPINQYEYRINTPYKLIGGFAYTFKSYGLISVDYELVDYSSTRMKEHIDYWGTNSFDADNRVIKNSLKAASNFRVGIEGNLPAGFALRAGYGFYGSPYKSSISNGDNYGYILADNGNVASSGYSMGIGDNTTNIYSAGVGYRFKNGFLDFGYSLTNSKTEYIIDAYNDYGIMAAVTTKNKFNRFALTLGLRF